MDDGSLLAQRLLEVVNDGKRDATYKLALLLALIDWAMSNPDQDRIMTRELASSVFAIYFRQLERFTDRFGRDIVLRQGAQKKVLILDSVAGVRERNPGIRQMGGLRRQDPRGVQRTIDTIERTLVAQPIPRLQRVGDKVVPFLYNCGWEPKQPLGPLRRDERDFIQLIDGVGERLVVFGPLIRPVIEQFWVTDVAKWSGITTEEERLRVHLFGRNRSSFPGALRRGLTELQEGVCFYCAAKLGSSSPIDHFVPWSRYPNDSVENLIVGCISCNAKKSDHLVSARFVRKWIVRSDEPLLTKLALETNWEANPARAKGVVVSAYRSVAVGSVLWDGTEGFRVLEKEGLREIRSVLEVLGPGSSAV